MPDEPHSPVAERVHDLLAPVISTTGADLVDVEWTGGTLRVVIDDDGGVTTEGLAKVNRLVSPILDQHDPVPGRYTLEVSSPGVERPLRRIAHYRRAIGEEVIVKMIPEVEPRRIRGELKAVEADRFTVDVVEIDGVDLDENQTHVVAIDDVSKARTVFEWGPTPKPGTGPKSKQKKNKKKSGGGPKKSQNPNPEEEVVSDE